MAESREHNNVFECEWTTIERLPTFERLRWSLDDTNNLVHEKAKTVIDVTKLGALERHVFIEKLLQKIVEDNHRLLQKLRERIDRVGIELPTVEVRYQNLSVESEYEVVRQKHLPTLWNTLKSILCVIALNSQANKIKILQGVRGIIKPSRMTLLLGPPGCGKTTLLQALAGKLDQTLKVTGDITYNGYKLNEFVPQKTSVYISQYDQHISEMTVRETLDFSARCQGIGSRKEIIMEVSRREKQAGIIPEPDVDTYMKATAIEGLKRSLQTDYILKILGLDNCADVIVGDALKRGISGGQKRRLTTGEMIIGPAKVLLMDEISTGLDSSTTFQIVTCIQQWTHITGSTTMLALLQPTPETFDLFDDVILMAEGKIVYQGHRDSIVNFFECCGFRCPPRKGIADFLQEVISRKDQAQYWNREDQPYRYVSVEDFQNIFENFYGGQRLDEELSQPISKSDFNKKALSFNIYSLRKWELLKACMSREWLLMKRNSFVHVFRSAQLVVVALITMTVFIRTRMDIDVVHGNYYMGSLFYALIRFVCNGIPELSMTVSRLSIFYKQRDLYFYPAWAYSIPAAILKLPFSLLDAFLWTALTYYVIGYSPEPERFFCQFILLFLVHQVSISLYRFIASVFRHPSVAAFGGLFSMLAMFLFGGFIVSRSSLPTWLAWGFWLSPLSYAEIGASVNEFKAPRWQKLSSSNATIGQQVLMKHSLNYGNLFYWISVGALIGFWIVFNVGFTCALMFLNSPRRSHPIVSHERSKTNNIYQAHEPALTTSSSVSMYAKEMGKKPNSMNGEAPRTNIEFPFFSFFSCYWCYAIPIKNKINYVNQLLNLINSTGMVLPFDPMTISFENVQYFVDATKRMKEQGFEHKRFQLLQDITGAFRPGVLTALMGVSGAGKTTLMDVLSGRKTGGVIDGDIRIGGYPKAQDAYTRISGYCEQNDIHCPQFTILESLTFSAWLRLPSEIDERTKSEFVEEVLKMIELEGNKNALVGLPGVSGISNEQRKRLTIAVELVSNPSILFMDEPTSGLDARAAAIVMRVVKNIVNTRRTVVCTIHQPSIDIFEAFDELLLMKKGGQIIYYGELGQHSSKLIEYFESIPGLPKIQENYNPATWMLEVTSPSAEAELGLDFAHLYKESNQGRKTKELVRKLSSPPQGSSELHFSTCFPQNGWEQFKACLWRQHLSYWRSPKYNLGRLIFIIVASFLFGAVLQHKGRDINDEQDLFNIVGSMFVCLQFLGIANCSSILPFITTERTIMYRERFAGMYSSWAYSLAQVTIEIPYVFLQAVLFFIITYPTVDFYWAINKAFWYLYVMFCTLLYFTYLGMLLVSLTPNFQVASVLASFSYTMLNLFSGYLMPGPKIPKWWVWCYWMCPTAWSLKGLLTSQYGDIDKEVVVFGEYKAINAFLQSHFGYNHDNLGVVALVLFTFPIVFASVFTFSTAKLNFQRR
ncbi:Sulfate-transporting ATPase [Bertholletia excelsa]